MAKMASRCPTSRKRFGPFSDFGRCASQRTLRILPESSANAPYRSMKSSARLLATASKVLHGMSSWSSAITASTRFHKLVNAASIRIERATRSWRPLGRSSSFPKSIVSKWRIFSAGTRRSKICCPAQPELTAGSAGTDFVDFNFGTVASFVTERSRDAGPYFLAAVDNWSPSRDLLDFVRSPERAAEKCRLLSLADRRRRAIRFWFWF